MYIHFPLTIVIHTLLVIYSYLTIGNLLRFCQSMKQIKLL